MTRPELLAAAARGMIFSTEMVWAILKGRKTRTMRVMKPQADMTCGKCGVGIQLMHPASPRVRPFLMCTHCCEYVEGRPAPRHKPGDIVYVRETWRKNPCGSGWPWEYRAEPDDAEMLDPWRPSIHMPREAARILLRVTGVKVQRPRELTAEEIRAEGLPAIYDPPGTVKDPETGKLERPNVSPVYDLYAMHEEWRQTWDPVQQKKDLPLYGYDANPSCWVYEFEVLEVTE